MRIHDYSRETDRGLRRDGLCGVCVRPLNGGDSHAYRTHTHAQQAQVNPLLLQGSRRTRKTSLFRLSSSQ